MQHLNAFISQQSLARTQNHQMARKARRFRSLMVSTVNVTWLYGIDSVHFLLVRISVSVT